MASEAYQNHPKVRVLTQLNGGKSVATNLGFDATTGELFICLDADTILKSDAISKLVRHFHDPKIAAVAGYLEIGNQLNILTKFQAIEYITAQNTDKIAQGVLNSINVVPGALGAWRRAVIKEIGGYSHNTLAEDMDITIEAIKHGYRVIFDRSAIAYTEAPDTLRTFIKQRFRWCYGGYQVLRKQWQLLFSPRYGYLSLYVMPSILWNGLFQLATPMIIIGLLPGIVDFILQFILGLPPLFNESFTTNSLLVSVGIFIFDMMYKLVALSIDYKKWRWGLIVLLPIQRLFYSLAYCYIVYISLIAVVRGQKVGWGSSPRKNTVSLPIGQVPLVLTQK